MWFQGVAVAARSLAQTVSETRQRDVANNQAERERYSPVIRRYWLHAAESSQHCMIAVRNVAM